MGAVVPREHRTLADYAFARLEEAITRGDLAPEAKLDEVALARAMGISRGPIREAIRRLEGRKLVERTPHVGARVASLDAFEIQDILAVREALEGMAARFACERMTDPEIDELDALLQAHANDDGLQAGDHYYQHPGDYDFHYRVIVGSRSPKLRELLLGDLYYRLRVFRFRSSVRPGRARQALDEHRDIIAALRARKPDMAERAMRRHVAHARLSAVGTPGKDERPR